MYEGSFAGGEEVVTGNLVSIDHNNEVCDPWDYVLVKAQIQAQAKTNHRAHAPVTNSTPYFRPLPHTPMRQMGHGDSAPAQARAEAHVQAHAWYQYEGESGREVRSRERQQLDFDMLSFNSRHHHSMHSSRQVSMQQRTQDGPSPWTPRTPYRQSHPDEHDGPLQGDRFDLRLHLIGWVRVICVSIFLLYVLHLFLGRGG